MIVRPFFRYLESLIVMHVVGIVLLYGVLSVLNASCVKQRYLLMLFSLKKFFFLTFFFSLFSLSSIKTLLFLTALTLLQSLGFLERDDNSQCYSCNGEYSRHIDSFIAASVAIFLNLIMTLFR